jgi:hypothetical protein
VDALAEALSRSGYRTVAFANGAEPSSAGLAEGFAEYHALPPESPFAADGDATKLWLHDGLRRLRDRTLGLPLRVETYYRPAEEVVDRAIAWLDARDGAGPAFVLLRLRDTTDPFMAADGAGVGYGRLATPAPPPAATDAIRAAYAAEVARVDRAIERLAADLRRRGTWDDTLVVVTAERGTALGERGPWWGPATLHREEIAVPLIVKPAGAGARGPVVEEPVGVVDVAPTILRAAGVLPSATIQGVALALDGQVVPARDGVVAEEETADGTRRALRTREWTLVLTPSPDAGTAARPALYRTADDPGETTDVAAGRAAERDALVAALGRATVGARERAAAVAATAAAAAPVSDATEDRLKALGYVE